MNGYPTAKHHGFSSVVFCRKAAYSVVIILPLILHALLTTFLLNDVYDDPAEQYLWEGMQTFHWSFHQRIAACYKKLSNIEECEKNIAEAYRLISVVWKDFEENKEQYMEYFYRYLKDYDLAEYIK